MDALRELRGRLSTRLVLLVLASALLPALLGGWVLVYTFTEQWGQSQREERATSARLVAARVNDRVGRVSNVFTVTAQRPSFQGALAQWDVAALQDELRRIWSIHPWLANVFMTDPDGTPRAGLIGVAPAEPESFLGQDFFVGALASDQPYVSTPLAGPRLGEPAVVMAYAVRGPDGRPLAILAATLGLQHPAEARPGSPGLAALFDEAQQTAKLPGERVVVASRTGQIIGHPNADRVLLPLSTETDIPFDQLLAGPGVRQETIDGETRLTVSHPIPSAGWVVVISVPINSLLDPMRRATVLAASLAVPVLLIMCLATLALARRLTAPLIRLARIVAAFGAGDRSARARDAGAIEVRRLATQFNRMADSLIASENELGRQANRQRVLAEASQSFATLEQDYETLLKVVAEQVALVTGDGCTVRLWSEDGKWLQPVAADHTDPAIRQALEALMGQTIQRTELGVWEPVIEEQRTVRLATPGGWLPPSAAPAQVDFMARYPMGSYMLVPLAARGNLLGGISLARFGEDSDPHTEDDETFLQDLATRAALAIDSARLYQEAQTSAQRLSQALEAAGATTWDWDLATGKIVWGGRIDRQLGLPDGSFPATFEEFLERVHPDDRDRVLQAIDRTLKEEAEYNGDFRVAIPDGTVRWLHGQGQVQRDQAGQPIRMMGVATDITDRMIAGALRAEALSQQQAAKIKDEVMSVVSHELRTPLAAVLGFAELLLLRDFPEVQRREFLTTILTEGRRLTALINDFLDLQRLEADRVRITAVPVDLAVAVQRAIEASGDDPERPIHVELPPDLPPVQADPDRLQQVLLNLLSNARKYSPHGGAITIEARTAPGDAVEITVADQGLGLPAEAMPKLFGTFYRVDNSDRREIRGTGLGLAIIKKIVETHGGQIWAASPGLGQGSTFGFTLPAAGPTAVIRDAPARVETPVLAGAQGDVLIVEDDPAYAAWLAETLKLDGYHTRVAGNAEAGLRAIESARPAVILLDLGLPGSLDGWDLLAVLRGRADTQDIPVVVVSAYNQQERGQALGVEDYLVKPVKPEHLSRILQRLRVRPEQLVLVVEDDPSAQDLLIRQLDSLGQPARGVGTGREVLALLAADPAAYGLVVLDLGLPDLDGIAVFDAIRGQAATRDLPVVIYTARDLTPADRQAFAERAASVVRKGNGVSITEAIERALASPAAPPPG